MTSLSHINNKTLEVIDSPDDLRIDYIKKNRWITYTKAREGMEKLEDLLHYPKTHRMPNLLILGNTNNGKTALVKQFAKRHPAYDNIDGESIVIPSLYIQAPPKPDEARLYNTILDSVYCPYKRSARVDEKLSLVLSLCREINLKMLIIDEIHHMLAGSMNNQRQFLQVIKYLGNELSIPIVAIGTREALRALQTDEQLANRFEPFALPRWELNKEYLQLLASFELMLPLKKPSHLATEELSTRLLIMSNGLLGELSTIIQKAAIHAIKTGTEKIDLSILKEINWVSPDERRKNAERLIQ